MRTGRGLNIIVFDGKTGSVLTKKTYDTYERSNELEKDIKRIPTGAVIAVGV